MMIDRQYSASAQVRIDQLKEKADMCPGASCVVDTLGFRDGDGVVTKHDCDIRRRFEVRSYQHVRVYGFDVVYYNARAKALKDEGN